MNVTRMISNGTSVTLVLDKTNVNWSQYEDHNRLFLHSVMQHANNVLLIKGHLFLNDVHEMLNMPRTKFGQLNGWTQGPFEYLITPIGDGRIRLEFRVDGEILDALED